MIARGNTTVAVEVQKATGKLTKWFSALCFIFPRFSLSYAFYLIPSLLAVRVTQKKLSHLFVFFALCMICCVISSLVGHVSITAFILSFVMQLPFLLFIFQFDLKEQINGMDTLRLINAIVMILSIFNMTLVGFPFRLPYKDFLPDAYSALYGQGGAKIVTITGFFGLVAELFRVKERRNKLHLTIAALNFIVPNYLIGMIMGLGALAVVALRKKLLLIPFVILIILIVAPYALQRFQLLNNDFAETTGTNPKVFAYIAVLKLYAQYPLSIFCGTGFGQFTSTPALWASGYISALSTHDIPELWGLNMSEYHQQVLGSVLESMSDDRWSLSSSASKPYSSITTILSEYGLLISAIAGFLFYRAFKAMDFSKKYTLTIFLFTIFLFATDLWHDSMWFGYLLILTQNISKESL